MKKYTSIFFCFACILFFGSCYYDKKDQIYIQPTATVCDTTNVTYTAVVAPIIKTNCSMCHSSAVANASGAGIVLDNYTSLKVYVSNNSLLNSILQNGTVPPMPLNAAKLDACTINKIAAWIHKGSLNN
jgi:uncharacterized membrane protein